MNGMQAPDGFDAKTIGAALGLKKSALHERAAREGWPYRSIPVRGGWKRLYHMAGLPPAVLGCVLRAQADAGRDTSGESPGGGPMGAGQPAAAGPVGATCEQLVVAMLRCTLPRLERVLAEADLFVGGGR